LEGKRTKAVVLISGGLDSTLAAKVLQQQGIEVQGVHFSTGFCMADHKRATAPVDADPKTLRNEALRAGADLKIPVEMVDLSEEYLEVVFNPKYGYGSNVNPCIDCRIMMLKKAKAYAESIGADFVATGEVVGQRPMSQRRDTMRLIEKESGLEGRLLRPLCAKSLSPTEPEIKGLVDRERLLALHGRGRRAQMDLIKTFGVDDYPAPAGGCCFLTDESFATRFKDKMAHRGEKRIGWEDVTLLKVGRHFRISPTLKLIVGRWESENIFLERFTEGRVSLLSDEVMGPIGLTDESLPTLEEEQLCSAIVARYSDGKKQEQVTVTATGKDQPPRSYAVKPLWDEAVLGPMRLLKE